MGIWILSQNFKLNPYWSVWVYVKKFPEKVIRKKIVQNPENYRTDSLSSLTFMDNFSNTFQRTLIQHKILRISRLIFWRKTCILSYLHFLQNYAQKCFAKIKTYFCADESVPILLKFEIIKMIPPTGRSMQVVVFGVF